MHRERFKIAGVWGDFEALSKFKMADVSLDDDFVEKNASIKSFLIIADLHQFEAAFQSEGITKVEHIRDVTNVDLKKIGEHKLNFFTRSFRFIQIPDELLFFPTVIHTLFIVNMFLFL